MNIIEALTLAKEQGKRVRPVCCKNEYIIYEDGTFRVKMLEMKNYDTAFEIYEHTMERFVLGEWEKILTDEEELMLNGKKLAIVEFCDRFIKRNEECTVCTEICPIGKICIKHDKEARERYCKFWNEKETEAAYEIIKEK